MNEKLEIKNLPVSCMNNFENMKYGRMWPTDPVLLEVNKKLDKILALLDKD